MPFLGSGLLAFLFVIAESSQCVDCNLLGRYQIYSIPYTQIKKIAAIKNHIWGL